MLAARLPVLKDAAEVSLRCRDGDCNDDMTRTSGSSRSFPLSSTLILNIALWNGRGISLVARKRPQLLRCSFSIRSKAHTKRLGRLEVNTDSGRNKGRLKHKE